MLMLSKVTSLVLSDYLKSFRIYRFVENKSFIGDQDVFKSFYDEEVDKNYHPDRDTQFSKDLHNIGRQVSILNIQAQIKYHSGPTKMHSITVLYPDCQFKYFFVNTINTFSIR